MNIDELERRITELRTRPLTVVCRTPDGKTKAMSLHACIESRAAYLYIARDDLDALLEAEIPKIERGTDAAERT